MKDSKEMQHWFSQLQDEKQQREDVMGDVVLLHEP